MSIKRGRAQNAAAALGNWLRLKSESPFKRSFINELKRKTYPLSICFMYFSVRESL